MLSSLRCFLENINDKPHPRTASLKDKLDSIILLSKSGRMKKKKYVFYVLLSLGIVLLFILLMQVVEVVFGGPIAMLFPKGMIALRERNLLFIVQALMLIVVIPVFILTFVFAWKYRAGNPKANYSPNWDHSKVAECIWWGIPCLIIIAIAVLTWMRTQQLDPFKPIDPNQKHVRIQVVALQWKWLFIYPEEKIASVNLMQFPAQTPIYFEITADAPMNSFWIPQLSGQVYAMPKMKTQLHLIANKAGSFRGSSANISGKGFAGMHFLATATSQEDFDQWVQAAQHSLHHLTLDEYNQLAKPSENNPATTYLLKEEDLFNEIIMKYMMPQ